MKRIFKMNIRNLDDLLIDYISEMKKGNNINLKNLWNQIDKIFDILENPSKDDTKKNEIKQMIHSKLQDKTLDYWEMKALNSDLVAYGYA